MRRASSARPPEKDSIWATALQATAAVARQGGSSEADVLRALTDALRRLEMRGSVMLLLDDGRLEVRSVALSRSLTTAMARLSGIAVVGYTFETSDVELLSRALQSRQAVFAPDTTQIVQQITPASARPLIPRIAKMLGDNPVIAAPCSRRSRSRGRPSAADRASQEVEGSRPGRPPSRPRIARPAGTFSSVAGVGR